MRIISGLRRGMKLSAPPGRETRPVLDRVKKSWFDVLGPRVEGAVVLDAFCGVGSLGLEALSRGAQRCVFIERSRDCYELLGQHLEKMRFVEQAKIMATSARTALDGLRGRGERFDCTFLDPPFALAGEAAFYDAGGVLDTTGSLLAPDGLLMLRREKAGKKSARPFEVGDSLACGLRVTDCRSWGRNEVVFMERGENAG